MMVVIVAAGSIVIATFAVAVSVPLTTCTVNASVPVAVGVPVIAPLGDNARPAGRAPPVTLHTYAAVPPCASSCVAYAVPTVPFGSDVVVMVSRSVTVIVTDVEFVAS